MRPSLAQRSRNLILDLGLLIIRHAGLALFPRLKLKVRQCCVKQLAEG